MTRTHASLALVLSVTAVSVALIAPAAVAGSAIQTPVRNNPDVWEDFPASGTDGLNQFFAWTKNSQAKPNAFNAFLQNTSLKGIGPIRVNPSNTRGYTGGIEGDRLLWQQVKRGQSDLRLYDYSQERNVAVPPGLNDNDWQWRPSFDGETYLYGQNRFNTPDAPWKVILATEQDGSIVDKIVLDSAKNRCKCIWPGQVVGDYATWTKCTTTCQVWIYEISSDTSTRVSNETARNQYHGVPDVNGAVYLARGGNGCGENVNLVSYAYGSGGRDLVTELPDGKDVTDLTVVPGSPSTIFFGRVGCTQQAQGDIFSIQEIAPTRVAAPAARTGSRVDRVRPPLPNGAKP
ncbi:MAG: hypothetical protein WEA10_04125 [Actinomycetota bacterium]